MEGEFEERATISVVGRWYVEEVQRRLQSFDRSI